jgi:hypothetical protein
MVIFFTHRPIQLGDNAWSWNHKYLVFQKRKAALLAAFFFSRFAANYSM